MPDETSHGDGATAQARRLYLHLQSGGQLRPIDLELVVRDFERKDATIAALRAPVPAERIEAAAITVAGKGLWEALPESANYMQRKTAATYWVDRNDVRADVRTILHACGFPCEGDTE